MLTTARRRPRLMARGVPQLLHTAIDAAVAVINSRRNHALFSHQALAANLYGNQRYVDIRHRALKLQHPGQDLPLVSSDESSDRSPSVRTVGALLLRRFRSRDPRG
jgi:hypothetical protein